MNRGRILKVGRVRIGTILVTLSIVIAACSSPATPSASSPGTGASSGPVAGDPATDKLAQILNRGTLVLSTDTAYPPQSMAVDGAVRLAGTKCTSNQLTGPEVTGFDVETGKAVAAALGVEPCFVVPSWTEITGGNWGDRWDVAWGSGAINADRMTRLYMTQPYYSDDQRFYVRSDSDFREISDLDGKVIGACASCTHEYYLRGTLEIPGTDVTLKVKDPEVVTYAAEPAGLQEVADGKIDAFLLADPVGEQGIKDGLAIRALDEVAFPLYVTGFIDRQSGLESTAFVNRINEIVAALHEDGSLAALSTQFFGEDLTARAAGFDLDSIGQAVP
jgi:polar amino acid transport system substrate-binding protein